MSIRAPSLLILAAAAGHVMPAAAAGTTCVTCPRRVLEATHDISSRNKDVVLAEYREGLLSLVEGDVDAAVFHLQEAEQHIERLRPKSISEAAASIVWNDRSRSYVGEDFEQAYVNYFLAVAYLRRGQLSEAMVEARRLNETLKELNRVYGDDAGRYGTDPALMILSGLLYEALGKPNDAFIDFRNAFEEYRSSYASLTGVQPPDFLAEAIQKLGTELGFERQIAELELDRRTPQGRARALPAATTLTASDSAGASLFDANDRNAGAKYGGLFGSPSKPASASTPNHARRPAGEPEGTLALLFETGRIGVKEEEIVTVPIPPGIKGHSGDIIRIKFPRFRQRTSLIQSARLRVVDGPVIDTELISDLTALSRVCLEDKLARIKTRAVMRALGKHAIAAAAEHQVAKKNSGLEGAAVGWLLKIAANASERADTRSIQEMPAAIHAARITLPPGLYAAEIEYLAATGTVAHREPIQVEVRADDTTFLWRRSCQ